MLASFVVFVMQNGLNHFAIAVHRQWHTGSHPVLACAQAPRYKGTLLQF